MGARVLLVFQLPDNADGKEKKGSQKLVVTSGEDIQLVGSCIYFFRINNEKELHEKFMDRVSGYLFLIHSRTWIFTLDYSLLQHAYRPAMNQAVKSCSSL
jgi:hypothetical protein